MFALAGQLALPGSVAQLGLDGVAYAPPRTPEGGEPFLGICTPGFAEGEGGLGPDTGHPPCDDPACSRLYCRNVAEYGRRLRESLAPDVPKRQLVLPEIAWDQTPRQTELWPAMDARLPLVPERQQKCQRTRFAEASDVGVRHNKSGKLGLSGVISCDRYTCPCCGRRKAREVAAKLGACFERHRETNPDGDHWMMTLAVPHKLDDGTKQTNAWLYDASARFWRSRAWERFAERWGIRARCRAFDASHGGKNGTHSHFHVAMFPELVLVPLATIARLQVGELEQQFRREKWERRKAKRDRAGLTTNEERENDRAFETEWAMRLMEAQALAEAAAADETAPTMPLRGCAQGVRRAFLRELVRDLFATWRDCVKRAGCPHSVSANAIDLLPSEKAEAYFVKWGLAEEIGLSVEKDRSHLRLLDIVCARLGEASDIAADLYHEFNEAMRGRAWVTGLADTCHRLEVTDEDAAAYVERMRERRNAELAREGKEPLPELPELHLVVRAHLWSAFLALGHVEVFAWLKETIARLAFDEGAIQRELDGFLYACAVTSRSDSS